MTKTTEREQMDLKYMTTLLVAERLNLNQIS